MQGFDGTTIDEIAAAADISPRTFFHYFPSKEDVLLADYATRLHKIVAALKTGPSGLAPWHALRGAFLTVAADYESEREQLLRRFRIIQSTPSVAARNLLLQASWEDAVTDAVSEWLNVDSSTDIRPRLVAGAALSAMRLSRLLACRQWTLSSPRPHHVLLRPGRRRARTDRSSIMSNTNAFCRRVRTVFRWIWLPIAVVASGFFVAPRILARRFAPPQRDASQTPADLGLPEESVWLDSTSGKRLHAWFIPVQHRAPLVIVLHGWGGNAALMLLWVPTCTKLGITPFFSMPATTDSQNTIDSPPCHGLPKTWKSPLSGLVIVRR